MLHLSSILLLATVQYGLTSDNNIEMKLCNDQNLELSLSQNIPTLRRQAVVASDPFPVSGTTTCIIRVNFDVAATVNLTLITNNIWNKFKPIAGAQGYGLETKNGEKRFVLRSSFAEGSSAWTNASSNVCPYLYVRRASRVSTPRSSDADAAQSIFNESSTLNTTSVVIELRDVPETSWCHVAISISASPMPEDYCQAKDQLYCNSSIQCLNASVRCNGERDCDDGEDEMDCSKGDFTEGFTAVGTTAGISVTICVFVILTAAVVAILSKRRCKRSRRKTENEDYSYTCRAGGSIKESTKQSYLVENDLYSPSPYRPESLKVSSAECVYYVLESECDRTSVSHGKSSE